MSLADIIRLISHLSIGYYSQKHWFAFLPAISTQNSYIPSTYQFIILDILLHCTMLPESLILNTHFVAATHTVPNPVVVIVREDFTFTRCAAAAACQAHCQPNIMAAPPPIPHCNHGKLKMKILALLVLQKKIGSWYHQ
jgi:hypothetical protein